MRDFMTKMNLKRFLEISKVYRLIVFMFVFSTLFFIWQHLTGISWDFASYVINGKFFLSQSLYFEWLRPPLMPLLISAFSIFGWLASEYIFIIAVSAFYLFASLRLANAANIDKRIFYCISLTPFLLNMSFIAGTELLSLALLGLFAAFILEKKAGLAGFVLGLAFLTRYTNIIFIPLILFFFFEKIKLTTKIKKIFLSAVFFLIPVSLWLIYNYLASGNALMSIASSYMLNISARQNVFTFIVPKHLLIAVNYYALLLIPGLIYGKKSKGYWLMLTFAALALYSYISVPLKTQDLSVKYLFAFLLPVFYFSAIFIEKFSKKEWMKIIFPVLIALNIMLAFSPAFLIMLPNASIYSDASQFLDKDCMTMSNVWVPLNYLGYATEPAPVEFNKYKIGVLIESGKRIFYFKKRIDEDYGYVKNETFIKQFNILNETDDFLLLGNKNSCETPTVFIENFGVNNCQLFVPKFLQKFC